MSWNLTHKNQSNMRRNVILKILDGMRYANIFTSYSKKRVVQLGINAYP